MFLTPLLFFLPKATLAAVIIVAVMSLVDLEAINHRLKDSSITLHLSEVKGPVLDQLKRSHFPGELTGKVHLTQFDAVSSIDPELANQTMEAKRNDPG